MESAHKLLPLGVRLAPHTVNLTKAWSSLPAALNDTRIRGLEHTDAKASAKQLNLSKVVALSY